MQLVKKTRSTHSTGAVWVGWQICSAILRNLSSFRCLGRVAVGPKVRVSHRREGTCLTGVSADKRVTCLLGRSANAGMGGRHPWDAEKGHSDTEHTDRINLWFGCGLVAKSCLTLVEPSGKPWRISLDKLSSSHWWRLGTLEREEERQGKSRGREKNRGWGWGGNDDFLS